VLVGVAGALVVTFAAQDGPWTPGVPFASPVSLAYVRQARFVGALSNPFRASPPLKGSPPMDGPFAALDRADVVLAFVEAYGVVTCDNPVFARALAGPREALTAAVHEAGRTVVSARVESPTFGASSWLAHLSLLTGIEVDINEDGTLDQDPDLLARLDVVVGSVHSALRMPAREMTARMLRAVADPHLDVLGHCTGRLVEGPRRRPESQFDADAVFAACAQRGVAVEVNSRPERLDPPLRLLATALEAGCLLAVDTDAHAPGQLAWQPYGVARAARCGAEASGIVTTWPAERVLDWTGGHAA